MNIRRLIVNCEFPSWPSHVNAVNAVHTHYVLSDAPMSALIKTAPKIHQCHKIGEGQVHMILPSYVHNDKNKQ